MAQKPPSFCTECGTPLAADQRFCANCGSAAVPNVSDPTVQASSPSVEAAALPATGPTIPNTNPPAPQASTGNDPFLTREQTDAPSVPPPPPPISGAYNPYTVSAPGGPQVYEQEVSVPAGGYAPPPPVSVTGAPNVVPPYARARKSHACLIVSIILLVVLAGGVGGTILLVRYIAGKASNLLATSTATLGGPTSSTGGGGSNGAGNNTPTGNARASEQVSLKITYASIEITINSVQLANSFTDDSNTGGQVGVVRLNLHEANNSTNNPLYLESDVLRLVLPNGNSIQSTNQQHFESPDSGVAQDNWVDFPLDTQVQLNQLRLRIGKSGEQQMDVPLKQGADLGKYKDKSSSPNAQFQYAGMNWTLQTATLSYSYHAQQATAGNLYLILSISVANNTANDMNFFPSDSMRVQASNNSLPPDSNTTLPYTVAASGTANGVVAFLVPQGVTSFTLVMLAQPNGSPPAGQVTQSFQVG